MKNILFVIASAALLSSCDYSDKTLGDWHKKVYNNTSDTLELYCKCWKIVPNAPSPQYEEVYFVKKLAPKSEYLVGGGIITRYDMNVFYLIKDYTDSRCSDYTTAPFDLDSIKKENKWATSAALARKAEEIIIAKRRNYKEEDKIYIFSDTDFE